MIKAYFYRNEGSEICGFKVEDHADSIVCAAVSALVTNCVNSIEELTDAKVKYKSEEAGGTITCELPKIKKGEHHRDADLLLRALRLGLVSIAIEYEEHICVYDKEV